MRDSVTKELIRSLLNRPTVDDDTDAADSTYSSEKIEASFVKKSGDTMTGDLHTSGYFRPDKIWHAYGGFQDAAETIAVGTKEVWYHITNGSNDLWTGLEGDGLTLSGDVMTFTNAGDYIGSLSITISALTGKDYHIRLYNNTQTAQVGYYVGVSTTGAGNQVTVSLPLYIEANAGDELQMEITCISSATDVVVDNAVFYLTYLHD